MAKKTAARTEIACIIDRSGSMGTMANEVIGGFGAFLREQQAGPDEARLTVALFDHEYELYADGVPIKLVLPLDEKTYVPRGTTALLDAIARTVNAMTSRIAGMKKPPTKVIVCIITDGFENASKEVDSAAVRDLLAEKEKDGWAFVFLAANQDAFLTARQHGIPTRHAHNYAANVAGGTKSAYGHMSAVTMSIRNGSDEN